MNELSMREESYLVTKAPLLEAARNGPLEVVHTVEEVKSVPGGVVLLCKTKGGVAAVVRIEILGEAAIVHCSVRIDGAGRRKRLVLARELAPCEVRVDRGEGRLTLTSAERRVVVAEEPFEVRVDDGVLSIDQCWDSEDAAGRQTALGLGFSRLRGGDMVLHQSFVAGVSEEFWGLGERFGSVGHRGRVVSCWNHDALGADGVHSYKNVPFLLSSRGYACFVDTTANAIFDCCGSSQAMWSMIVPDEELSYYLFFGPPRKCLKEYQGLVGGPELPPAWVIGAWVSTGARVVDEGEVRQVADELDRYDVPCDVLHIDAHWQRFGNWSDLDWDREKFPEPRELLSDLRARGLRSCLWINPYIGVRSPVFAAGEEMGWFLKSVDGTTYIGKPWGTAHPPCGILDFTNPEAARWFAEKLGARLREGVTAIKTDFGEEIPADVVARDGMSGDLLHNAYSLLYNDVVVAAMKDAGVANPIVWARASWAGGQRHVAQWAGDAASTWQEMAATLRAGLSIALSGHAFWSHDIGGFHGEPSSELYVRWAQFGMLSAVSRFHGTTTRFPWDYGEEGLQAVRHVVRLRYALHPYLYGAAWESVREGVPIMRPMVFEYPEYAEARCADLQYLLGANLLVAPLCEPGGHRTVWFPPGEWVHYATSESFRGPGFHVVEVPMAQAPMWVRAGSILPVMRPRGRIGDGRYEELTLVVVPDAQGRVPLGYWPELPGLGSASAGATGTTSGEVGLEVPGSWPSVKVAVIGDGAWRATVNGEPAVVSALPALSAVSL